MFVKSAVQKTAHAEKKAYLLRQLHNEKIAGEQRLMASLHVTVQTEIEEWTVQYKCTVYTQRHNIANRKDFRSIQWKHIVCILEVPTSY